MGIGRSACPGGLQQFLCGETDEIDVIPQHVGEAGHPSRGTADPIGIGFHRVVRDEPGHGGTSTVLATESVVRIEPPGAMK